MTSFLTTGGIRGGSVNKFQPRSFNMGLSEKLLRLKGFEIYILGRSDLSIRL
jgi:hypothetical protein